jgi:hypothetical protein
MNENAPNRAGSDHVAQGAGDVLAQGSARGETYHSVVDAILAAGFAIIVSKTGLERASSLVSAIIVLLLLAAWRIATSPPRQTRPHPRSNQHAYTQQPHAKAAARDAIGLWAAVPRVVPGEADGG